MHITIQKILLIYPNINISQQETKELLKIDINNFEQNKVFYSQKNIQISPVFKASIKKLKKSLAEKN